jgi:hypothetical protein
MTRENAFESKATRFDLAASAIAGRTLWVAVGEQPPWTDGRIVHVRGVADIRRQVILQAALIRAGSLAPELMRPLVGRPTIARRYLAVEGRRALSALSEILPPAAMPAVDRLLTPPSNAEVSLHLACSRTPLPEAPEWFGRIRARQALDNAHLLGPNTVEPADSDAPQSVEEVPPPEPDVEDKSEQQDRAPVRSRVAIFDRWLSRTLRGLFANPNADQEGYSGGQGGTSNVTKGRPGKGKRQRVENLAVPDASAPRTPEIRHHVYPEWDHAAQAYRPDWCAAFEFTPPAAELRVLERPPRHDGLRRSLGPIGLAMRRKGRQRGGFDLDLDAAVEMRVSASVGDPHHDAVYVDNVRLRRELSILVLLDASGSTNELNPAGSVLHQRQREASAALVDTLAILGDRVAGYAFRSRGRALVVTKLKGFDENFGELQMARLGGTQAEGYSRIGAAVRHATRLLIEDRATPHRLLVLITDGFPYDDGYEHGYAEADVRQALSETYASGVGCLVLNLASATDEAMLERVFGTTVYAPARDIDELAPAMRTLFIRAIAAAQPGRHVARPNRAHSGKDAVA